MKNHQKIGEILKKFRIMKGYTQIQLASELSDVAEKKIAPPAIAAYESGQRVPKIDTRVQIANILNVDPIELSGIELSETDKKRLLCKLITEFATEIKADSDGNVNVQFNRDLYGFFLKYSDITKRVSFLNEDFDEKTYIYQKQKQDALEELQYWLETYPRYDPVSALNKSGQECSGASIKELFETMEPQFEQRFYDFYDTYLTPLRNKEERTKNKNN